MSIDSLWYNHGMTLGEQSYPSESPSTPPAPAASPEEAKRQQRNLIIFGIIAVLCIAALIAFFVFLLLPSTDPELVVRIRNIFIIYISLITILIGVALTIFIIQAARFTNFLQNEIEPILETTNETVNTVRGTAEFLGENLIEPTMKMNEYVAALLKLLSIIRFTR